MVNGLPANYNCKVCAFIFAKEHYFTMSYIYTEIVLSYANQASFTSYMYSISWVTKVTENFNATLDISVPLVGGQG